VPNDPNTLLTRTQTAHALTEAGYPTSPATLATRASRGGGPPFQKYGPRAIYRWGSSLAWAKGRLSDPVHTTSELHTARQVGLTAMPRSTQRVIRMPLVHVEIFAPSRARRNPDPRGCSFASETSHDLARQHGRNADCRQYRSRVASLAGRPSNAFGLAPDER
jgi:hypothetical protein